MLLQTLRKTLLPNLVATFNRSAASAAASAAVTESGEKTANPVESATADVPAPAQKDELYQRLDIELRGIDPAVMRSYAWFATTAAGHLGIEVGKCWAPRKAHHDRRTLLKSVHIYKKHRVQYEVRTHFRYMEFKKLTGSTLETFLEYIERNLPEGVALNAKKTRIEKLPYYLAEKPAGI